MKAVVIHAAKDLRIEERPREELRAGQLRVRVAAGGICGSDLHYFFDGGFGAVRLRQPMILGHEVSGTVIEVADGVSGSSAGQAVAVSPSRPCHDCNFCTAGLFNHCLNMRFYGSAMPMPHIQGAFCQDLVVEAPQCFPLNSDVPVHMGAFAEPLAVVLHAISRAGPVNGKRVLVTGCGPIGALTVMAAKHAEAREVVVTDVLDSVLSIAREIGADRAINVAEAPGWTESFSSNKGHFDVMFEASGNELALRTGIEVLAPRATLVQIGLGGDVSIPQNTVVAKELELRGAFRFHEEFGAAVELIGSGALDLDRLLTARMPFSEATAAFELAGNRSKAMKVQLDFTA